MRLLKAIQKPTPGSHQVKKKEDPKPFADTYMVGE